jgi:hypothetical protein
MPKNFRSLPRLKMIGFVENVLNARFVDITKGTECDALNALMPSMPSVFFQVNEK